MKVTKEIKMGQIKNILTLVTLLILSQNTWAQTSSPYSRYGLGTVSQKGSVRSRTMGGTGVGMQHRTDVNNLNPSALVAMDSTAVLFDLGFHANISSFNDGLEQENTFSGNIDYITLMVPISRFWFTSLSMQPLSDVGYNINTIKNYSGNDEYYGINYTGTGGGSLASMTNSIKLPWGISIGAEVGILWGNHDETITEVYSGMDVGYTARRDVNYYQGLYALTGFQWAHLFNTTKLVIGGTYNIPTLMRAESEQTITSALNGVTNPIDKTYTNISNEEIPMAYSLGFSLEFDKKMTIAADYKFTEWSSSNFGVDAGKYSDNHAFNLGFEMVPNFNSVKYRERVAYRAGLRHETGYFSIGGDQVETSAVTFGLGLPGRMSNTIINVGFEVGTIGAFNSKHITETYGQINVGLNLGEIWFIKPKFN